MSTFLNIEGGVLEHLLVMALRSEAHVLLTERLCVLAEIGSLLFGMSVTVLAASHVYRLSTTW
jgi:hypothetical protein